MLLWRAAGWRCSRRPRLPVATIPRRMAPWRRPASAGAAAPVRTTAARAVRSAATDAGRDGTNQANDGQTDGDDRRQYGTGRLSRPR
ncbi:hypothetical protein CY652_02315 [Burkholderia sp. WAC0059]|nr:hypothetical protein CY652_02315 [Burkholderia sp. WAC0059]